MANLDRLIAHVGGSAVEAGLGAEPLAVRPGHVTARLPLTERTRTPDGRASPFALGMFADLGIGIAVNSAVEGSAGGPTVELTIALAADPHPDARELLLEADALSVSRVTGLGRAEIRDDTGTVVANVLGIMATEVGATPPRGVPAATRFDPRSVTLQPLSEDFAHARVSLDDTMVNSRAIVHGGVLTGIAMPAQEAFCGTDRRQLTVAARFLRPAPPSLGYLECRSEFVRRGRRFHTVRTVLLRPDGAVIMEATGTSVTPAA